MTPIDSTFRILISGYFGYSNTGDEAILRVILAQLRERLGAGARIQVISGSPEETAAAHGVDAVLWSDAAAIAEAVGAADLVVTGGGGIFHDYGGIAADGFLTEGNWGIGFHATAGVLAALLGKPLAVCGVGVGPLLAEAAGLYVRAVFGAAGYVSVRDEESERLARLAGVEAGQVRVSADPAFLLEPAAEERARAILIDEGIPEPAAGALRVMVAVRHWTHGVDAEEWERELAAGLAAFGEGRPGTQIVFVPFQRFPGELEDDLTVARRVRERLGAERAAFVVEGRYRPEEIAALVGQASLVVAMRLHAAIFAASAGVPFVAITYDGKVRQLLERCGRAWAGVDPAALRGEAFAEKMARALEAGAVGPAVAAWRLSARADFDAIAALGREGRPARLTGPVLDLVRQGVLALTGRERFLRGWLKDQKTNYEYMVAVAEKALAESRAQGERERAVAAEERESAARALAAEQATVADLRSAVEWMEGEVASLKAERAALQEAKAGLLGDKARLEADKAGLEADKAGLEGDLRGLRAEHQAAVAQAREREAAWSSYGRQMQEALATYRGQRAWRVMLAVRKAYTVGTRRGWLAVVPWLVRAATGNGAIESEQLLFPVPPLDKDQERG